MILVPLSAFALCVLLNHLAISIFPKLKLLDFPVRYGLTRSPIPYPTGILAILTFILFFSILEPIRMQSIGVIFAVLILGIYTFADDRTPLPSWMRIVVQALIAIIIFATGSRIYTITNPLEGVAGFGELIKLDTFDVMTAGFGPLPFWSGVFTVFWLMLTINALNWFDGISGQVSSLSAIGFMTIAFLSLSSRVDQPELAMIAFVLSAIAFGCLLFDFPPPKVLMGDTGAMFFGLMLGILTIYSGGKVATAFLVLGVPLIDSGLVIISRLSKGRSPFKGSTSGEHIHHRLMEKGWSERKVIFMTVILGSLFGVTALFLSTKEKFVAAVVLLLIMISLRLYSRKPGSYPICVEKIHWN
ncbi:undecaprenyl/decaprenyl-phosphate alpha-N-acetylglucosaminyl 1-phosphate transferase [Patescibacteria group bacterium]|nr:undecaprenyl/decaprenyl-phosphate alpha-N-acetylglucosaminyl 1-phosphate transferase [Patescibacteria group bacterium]MBU1123871.1 undecaprenyl/decaprenyl-phosphate alpha-N-acetylglucosaminyl 1-phosphate transferase [Patescibacteria group bacterium]MBU1911389.1 undecaprenyl/decaprenyl-phosphate alpha-N-acetylglucosaminyl 1-phosphate transferase [Patescibacteria group bacterium]